MSDEFDYSVGELNEPHELPILRELQGCQDSIGRWSEREFDDQPSWIPLLGAVEELGEVAKILVKRKQGIREDELDLSDEELEKEVADVIIYLMDFCHREDISLPDGVARKSMEVLDREFDADIKEEEDDSE